MLSLAHIRNYVLHSMGNHKLKPFYRVCALELNSTDIDLKKKKSYFENQHFLTYRGNLQSQALQVNIFLMPRWWDYTQ